MKPIIQRSLFLMLCFSAFLLIWGCDINLNGSDDDVSNSDSVVEEPFSFAVEVQNQTRLELEAINGNIEIVGVSDADSVFIEGVRRVGSESIADAEEHLNKLQVNISDLSSEILVETIQPKESRGRNYVVEYEITLPKDLELSVGNVNGNIFITTIENNVAVSNVNGNIDVTEIVGSTSVNLVNGNINSRVTLPVDGRIELATVNGNLSVAIPQNTSAGFSANLTNGTIRTSNLEFVETERTPRSLRGRLGDGQGTITLSTVNGNISMTGF